MLRGFKQKLQAKAADALVSGAIDRAEEDEELEDFKQAAADARSGSLTALATDNRAQMNNGANKAVNLVVALVVAGLMAAFLLPIAIDEISSVDTSSWDEGAAALWNILPVMVVLAIFLFFVGLALSRR